MANMLHKVFVYGTLKKGEPNHGWFSKKPGTTYKFICNARTVQTYPLIIGTKYNIPFLLYSPAIFTGSLSAVCITSNLAHGHNATIQHIPIYVINTNRFILEGNGNHVKGEVYEVDDQVFEDLDVLEDHPNYYIREEQEVQDVDSGTKNMKVWIYFMKNFKPELLKKTQYDNYSSNGSHGFKYVERYLRNESSDYRIEILNSEK